MSEYFANERIVAERIRLKRQEQILNGAVNVLASVDMAPVHDLLDLACGTGRWAIEAALKYPEKRVVGIDNDPGILEFARAQADAEDAPVEFLQMNALEPLAFPDNSFDLINTRLICGFLHRDKWPILLAECKRILRPGGTLITAEQGSIITNEYEYEQRGQCFYEAFHRVGYSFADNIKANHLCVGIMLPSLLKQAGFTDVTHKAWNIDFSYGAEAHEAVLQNFVATDENSLPFVVRSGSATKEEVEALIAYLRSLLHKPGFVGFWHFISATGQKP